MESALNTLAFLGSLGPMEASLIFIVILLLFGAKKLPELARGFGKSMNEFKKARQDFETEIKRGEFESEKELNQQSKLKSEAEAKSESEHKNA